MKIKGIALLASIIFVCVNTLYSMSDWEKTAKKAEEYRLYARRYSHRQNLYWGEEELVLREYVEQLEKEIDLGTADYSDNLVKVYARLAFLNTNLGYTEEAQQYAGKALAVKEYIKKEHSDSSMRILKR